MTLEEEQALARSNRTVDEILHARETFDDETDSAWGRF